jgi:hypothetical protein
MSNKQQTPVSWLQSEIDNKDMGEIPMWIYEFIDHAIEIESQKQQKYDEMLDFINRVSGEMLRNDFVLDEKWYEQARQLIKEAKEL